MGSEQAAYPSPQGLIDIIMFLLACVICAPYVVRYNWAVQRIRTSVLRKNFKRRSFFAGNITRGGYFSVGCIYIDDTDFPCIRPNCKNHTKVLANLCRFRLVRATYTRRPWGRYRKGRLYLWRFGNATPVWAIAKLGFGKIQRGRRQRDRKI